MTERDWGWPGLQASGHEGLKQPVDVVWRKRAMCSVEEGEVVGLRDQWVDGAPPVKLFR